MNLPVHHHCYDIWSFIFVTLRIALAESVTIIIIIIITFLITTNHDVARLLSLASEDTEMKQNFHESLAELCQILDGVREGERERD